MVNCASGRCRARSRRSTFTGIRVAIHGPTDDPPELNAASWKGEAKIAGTAAEVESGSAAHRFLINIQEAVITRLNDAGNRLVVESWTEVRGYRITERD